MNLRKKAPAKPRLELVGVSENIFRVWCEGLTPGKPYTLVGSVSDAHGSAENSLAQANVTFEPECEQQLVEIGFPKDAASWHASLRVKLALRNEYKMLVSLLCERKVDLNDGWRPVMASYDSPASSPARFWLKRICFAAVMVIPLVLATLFRYLFKGTGSAEAASMYEKWWWYYYILAVNVIVWSGNK